MRGKLGLAGQEIIIYGDGKQTRDFTYIEDTIHMSLLAGIKDQGINQVLNFGTGKDVSINMLADMVLTSLNLKGKIKTSYVNYDRRRSLEIEVFNRIADTTRAETLLSYKPATDLGTGLQKYIDWYRSRK